MDKKYQYSIKLENGEIFVIHEDSFNTLKTDIELLKIYLKGQETRKDIDSVPTEDELEEKDFEEEMDNIPEPHQPTQEPESYCPVHKLTMKERNGTDGKFYSHARQLKNNSWDYCSGKGWKSEK